MRLIRSMVLRGLDGLSILAQVVGKSYGFLSDGREIVASPDERWPGMATLPDKSDEGWPAFSVPLPEDSRFLLGASSVLTRLALWETDSSRATLLERFVRHYSTVEVVHTSSHGTDRLDYRVAGVRLKIVDSRRFPGRTLVSLKQRRTAEAMGVAAMARLGHKGAFRPPSV